MAVQGNLISKQYNSPINLYSQENVSEALHKQKQVLANGAVGIDFHHLAKPGNLANSAVLRMLEEEERSGRKGLKRVAWPPPPEDIEGAETATQESVHSQSPATAREATPPVRQTPASPQASRRHGGFHPVSFEPPKTTVILRPSPPISQAPAPVYQAQPVAASVQGGARMRGDQKWPPESVKQQTEAENAARIALAKGPAFRPRKVQKDYSNFFAQHALNPTYPGYRAPPGTQHYSEGSNF
uniref:Zasp-like motif domain-containing protein n=1 Tax=Riptortus pedestris TaxID=329032 RepID=R4WDF8_RIPPE|nr:conserved hypothetical protein [Riptortus pedestris]